jgi:hypothetical protein
VNKVLVVGGVFELKGFLESLTDRKIKINARRNFHGMYLLAYHTAWTDGLDSPATDKANVGGVLQHGSHDEKVLHMSLAKAFEPWDGTKPTKGDGEEREALNCLSVGYDEHDPQHE